jgi:PAS domain S-box-containing protein
LGKEFALRAGLVLDNARLYRDAKRQSYTKKTITDNAAACLVLVDADDHATFMNPAAVTMTGYCLGDLEGRRLHDVLHGIEATRGASAEADAPPWSSPTRAREDTFVRRDGTSFPASCNVAPLAQGGAVIEFRDLTVEKQAEHFRELFVGMLGHDLRNPLGAIVLSATLVLERGGLPAEDERILHLLLSSAERMNRMIEQILDFTRGRLGGGIPIVRKRIDLCELVRRIIDEGAVAHPERVFDLVMPFACEGEWDPDRLEQVVSNLVGNAITHGLANRPIQIRVACAGEIVELVIQNEGAPIPAELLPVLFDPFRRGAAPGTSTRGLGLGLYITEQIVHAHRGKIRVQSTAEDGVTFAVTLPLHASAGQP